MGLCSALKLPGSPAATGSRLLKVSGASAPSPRAHFTFGCHGIWNAFYTFGWNGIGNAKYKMKNWELLQPKEKVFQTKTFSETKFLEGLKCT